MPSNECKVCGERFEYLAMAGYKHNECPDCYKGRMNASTSSFVAQVDAIATLVKSKNVKYGNSFGTAGEALKILYPAGIKPEQYANALLITRIWDKLKRLATDNDAGGEDPFLDIAGYAVCGLTQNGEAK